MEAAAKPERLALTESNLRRLQPSLIRPMPPMSISSGDDDDDDGAAATKETPAERVARLKTWVYNAMQTLVGLGAEGVRILEADELYIAGPGDVRLREDDDGDDGGGGDCPRDTGRLKVLEDPAYWEAKLRYLEAKCKPLSQARRKRRRLAPEAEVAAEDAERADAEAKAAEGAGYFYLGGGGGGGGSELLLQQPFAPPHTPHHQQTQGVADQTLQELEEARMERERVEQSKLLWRDKRGSIEKWVQTLPPVVLPPPMPPQPPAKTAEPILFPFAEARRRPRRSFVPSANMAECANTESNNAVPPPPPPPPPPPLADAPPAAASSDSSVVEITSTQFSHARHHTHQHQTTASDAITTPAPLTAPVTSPYGGGAGSGAAAAPAKERDATTVVLRQPPPQQPPQQPSQQPKQQQPRQRNAPATAAVFSDISGITAATAATATETPNTSASPGAGPLVEERAAAARTGLPRQAQESCPSPPSVLGKRQRHVTDDDDDE